MSYVIFTDSTTDLPVDFVNTNNIKVIPMKFIIEGKEYKNYLDEREMKAKDFYDLERKGVIAKTAQLTTFEIVEAYKEELDKGNDILAIGFSSGLSGTFNSMRLAKEELEEEYKDRKILIIDSLCASMGEGLFVYYANLYKNEGLSLEENYQKLLELRPHLVHWFTVENLNTLRRGGRVSNATAFIANALNIKPVLHVEQGALPEPAACVCRHRTVRFGGLVQGSARDQSVQSHQQWSRGAERRSEFRNLARAP